MLHEDLEKPLKARESAAGRGKPKLDGVALLAIAAGGALALVAGWALFVKDPLGGEPVATASIERRAPPRPAGEAQPAGPAAPAAQAPAQPDHAEAKPETSREGVPVVNPGDPMPKAGPVIIRVPGADGAPATKSAAQAAPSGPPGAVQTAMLEDSKFGALPRIASDGKRPLEAYARPASPKGPRVALIISGLGTGRDVTAEALKSLPGDVTFAFSPYGADVANLVAEARRGGHEVLLQAPMEPFSYPQNDPGPQTLLTSLPAAANLDRLRWTLGRASGYVGIAPLAGGRFLQADDALAPVFTELARRGLMFAAQGQSESRFGVLAEQSGLPHARAASQIDASPDPESIDTALADLERDAKASGAAVGFAGATPLTLKRISAWAKELSARGVTLVPITATLKPQGPS